jgi:hypothetical protein
MVHLNAEFILAQASAARVVRVSRKVHLNVSESSCKRKDVSVKRHGREGERPCC